MVNNQKQCLIGQLRLDAISRGIDVDKLDNEFNTIGNRRDQARKNIRKNRGWLKHFFIVLVTESPFSMLGYTHPEEEEEYERLKQLNDAIKNNGE